MNTASLACVRVRPHMQAPQGCLQNPHNLCYLNSASQAFAWMGQLTGQEDRCYGSACAAVRPVLRVGRVLLPQCMPWHVLLRGWRGLANQQDVCQFMGHLLDAATPWAYQGKWEARLDNPSTVVDAGTLRAPILMDLRGPGLKDVILAWNEQHSVMPCQVTMAFSCCSSSDTVLLMVPMSRTRLPFAGSQVSASLCRFSVTLLECGPALSTFEWPISFVTWEHTHTGHFQTVVCVPKAEGQGGEESSTSWGNFVLNDNSKPRRATARDTAMLERNCYLIGLVFDPGQ